MGLPVQNFEMEITVEQRVAALEAHFGHIRSDVAEIKGHIIRLDGKIDALAARQDAKFDALSDKLSRHTFWLVGLIATVAISTAGGFAWMVDKLEP